MNDRAYSYWENFEAPADFSTTHSAIDFTPPESTTSAESSNYPIGKESSAESSTDSALQAQLIRNQTDIHTGLPNTSTPTPYSVLPPDLARTISANTYRQRRKMTKSQGTTHQEEDDLYQQERTSQRSYREEEHIGDQNIVLETSRPFSVQSNREDLGDGPQDGMMPVLQNMIHTLQNINLNQNSNRDPA